MHLTRLLENQTQSATLTKVFKTRKSWTFIARIPAFFPKADANEDDANDADAAHVSLNQ
jgi:hypothetical protein